MKAAPAPPRYREFEPRADLAAALRCVWIFEAEAGAQAPQRIAPDGRPELIVHFGAPYAEIGADGAARAQPATLFAGQVTRPLVLHARGRVSVLGVRFRADGARGFAGRALSTLTDERIALPALHGAAGASFSAAIAAAPDWAARIALASDYVAARGTMIDAEVRAAVARLRAGEAPGTDAASERRMQRRFLTHVGVSARTLGQICRFRRVFEAIESPAQPGWVEAAAAAGYFDQPQMARDFRRFLGVTATQWARQSIGLGALLTQAAPETYKTDPASGG